MPWSVVSAYLIHISKGKRKTVLLEVVAEEQDGPHQRQGRTSNYALDEIYLQSRHCRRTRV